MGYDWGIGTLAYFYASGLLIGAFSPTTANDNAPQSFFIGNGA